MSRGLWDRLGSRNAMRGYHHKPPELHERAIALDARYEAGISGLCAGLTVESIL
jgi:hypothetical protein